MSDITWTNTTVRLGDLKPWADNPRTSSKAQARRILKSFEKYGQVAPIAIDPENQVLDGHQRLSALLTVHGAGYEVEARRSSRPLTDEERRGLVLALANATGSWNWDSLSGWNVETLTDWGFDADTLKSWRTDVSALNAFIGSEEAESGEEPSKTLAERFGVPPFSVLDARQGYWQDRKRAWIEMGIESEVGRGDTPGTSARSEEPTYREIKARTANYAAISQAPMPLDRENGATGTSIFDPVLCELAYTWFCPPLGKILDPFAGGSVRGIVATKLDRRYTGIDLSARQIEANEKQAKEITPNNLPRWVVGNSLNVKDLAPGQYDFVFSCPPYFDLEVYSDDPSDLSTMEYPEFLKVYREIIAACVSMLKDNRFACFVVGDIRDKKGFYRNFPADTIAAFQDAGMTLYNEAILVTAVGSLPIRIGKQFGHYRKLGKTHQNVLVFYKGNPKAIKEDFGEIEIKDLAEQYGEIA